ncbi:MBL fold metallo-hydrolase [Myxococcota bacterium]|nr:MBL fold metallo-hydrolase [Myxococcota bacterium]
MRRLAALAIAPLALTFACDKPDRVIEEDVLVAGQVKSSLTAASGNLQIVSISSARRVTTVPINADGTFSLRVARNSSYSLNMQDKESGNYIASFLYRSGQNLSLSLNVGVDDIDLGVCQLLDGEVFCENGFFDSPEVSGTVTPVTDMLGKVRVTVDSDPADQALLERLLGNTTFDVELQPNPENPFNIALWNTTHAECTVPLVGSAEANADERYLYTQRVYSTESCIATARFQANCTLTGATCDGFLRVDVTSSGSDCSEFPPTHVAHAASFEVIDAESSVCELPATCQSNVDCDSGICDLDAGFCRNTERPEPLRIFHLDVGQGDSTLVTTPGGGAILIDGGRTASGRLTASLIRRLAGHLDYTIATHYDGDHVSGLSPIVRGPDGAPGKKGLDDNANGTTDEDAEIGAPGSDDLLPLVAALDRGIEPTASNLDTYIKSMGARRRAAMPGETLTLPDANVVVTVVAANGRILDGTTIAVNDENDRSVGVLLEYGDFSYLTLGDMPGGGGGSKRLEQAVATAIADRLPIDVLHLSHHGSAASSQPDFLAAVAPVVAINSVGDSETCGPGFNTYGLPAQQAIDNLRNQPTVKALYQTELGGASFSGACVLENNQMSRQFGPLEPEVSYGTLTVEAWPQVYRVVGLTFDDQYDATNAPASPANQTP